MLGEDKINYVGVQQIGNLRNSAGSVAVKGFLEVFFSLDADIVNVENRSCWELCRNYVGVNASCPRVSESLFRWSGMMPMNSRGCCRVAVVGSFEGHEERSNVK